MNKKNVPLKNYLMVFVMFFVTIMVVLLLRGWYRSYKEYNLTIPVINGKISQIGISQLDNYIMEHDLVFLYIGTSDNKQCRNLEKKLPEVLIKRNIKEQTIYLNMDNISNNEVIKKLKKYGYSEKNIEFPAFLIINNKLLLNLKTNKGPINISDIDKILDEYEIGD